MTAPIISLDDTSLARVRDTLLAGGLVAMPTETVYGLAADGANAAAIARLYDAKGRPQFNPLIAHVRSAAEAAREGTLNAAAERCVDAFWPGPLTVVVPVAETGSVDLLARAGLDTIALRQPNHVAAQAILDSVNRPLVAPSANRSGEISPVTARTVADGLGDRIDLIVDGGRCTVGLESTVVDFTTETPTLLRPGGIPVEALEDLLGQVVPHGSEDLAAPKSPGQGLRHYAPGATLRLNALSPEEGEGWLGYGVSGGDLNLSPAADLREAAANLFHMMRELDQRFAKIAVAPVPDRGLGAAINDRLRRASTR